MDDSWPQSSADLSKSFKSAHDAEKKIAPPLPQELVSKQQLEAMEKQRIKPTLEMHLKPPGAGASQAEQNELNARIQRAKERLKAREGQAQKDFERSNGG